MEEITPQIDLTKDKEYLDKIKAIEKNRVLITKRIDNKTIVSCSSEVRMAEYEKIIKNRKQ